MASPHFFGVGFGDQHTVDGSEIPNNHRFGMFLETRRK